MKISCDEFKDSAAAFVMGILDEGERKACALHLTSITDHQGCLAVLAEARQISAELAAALPRREPARDVWRAIEARVDSARLDRAARLRTLRELAAWFVAAAVLGLYLYGGRVETQSKALAREDRRDRANVPAEVRSAIALLGDEGSKVYAFRPAAPAPAAGLDAGELPARASLILSEARKRAVVVGDHLAPTPGKHLGLWVEKAPGRLDAVGELHVDQPGTAIGDLGPRLFAPGWAEGGRLLVSMDDPDAGVPGDVLMTAELSR